MYNATERTNEMKKQNTEEEKNKKRKKRKIEFFRQIFEMKFSLLNHIYIQMLFVINTKQCVEFFFPSVQEHMSFLSVT